MNCRARQSAKIMTEKFRFTFPSELKKNPYYMPPDLLEGELTNLESAMVYFCEWYFPSENMYHLVMGGETYTLYVNEMDRLFHLIPYHLQEVVSESPAHPFGITSQGTNMAIIIEGYSGDDVIVSLDLGPDDRHLRKPDTLRIKNSQHVKINQRAYILEWWRFAEWVTAILVRDKLIDANDPSLKAYLEMMPPKSSASLEKYLLQILSRYSDGLNWYGIAIRLSNTDAPDKSDFMKVLRRLTEKGYLEKSENGRLWKITEAGLSALGEMD